MNNQEKTLMKKNRIFSSIHKRAWHYSTFSFKKEGNLYTIVAGERRWRAAKLVGIKKYLLWLWI